ncbi:MAG: hypothetical protein J0L77_03945 [Alphaproteobacteria bacterium]|nr:hypothetical protein [Alphaproteobacteria bacterium]
MVSRFRFGMLAISLSCLSACSHYSADLAALESKIDSAPQPPVQVAMNDAQLSQMAPAAGGDMGVTSPAVSFQELLAREYLRLAQVNEDAMDYKTARYYTMKAKSSATGQPTPPGTPAQFGLTGKATPALQSARAELTAALTHNMVPANFASLVSAQTQFDAWMDDIQDGRAGAAEGFKSASEVSFRNALSQVVASSLEAVPPASWLPSATNPQDIPPPAQQAVVPAPAQGMTPISPRPQNAPYQPPAPLPPANAPRQVNN